MKHLVIPDTQIRPEVDTSYIPGIANLILHHQPDHVIMLGDWYDMASLSSYESKGSSFFEGRSYRKDIDAGNDALREFMEPLQAEYRKKRKKKPKFWFLLGNHEDRISRAVSKDPILADVISLRDLHFRKHRWTVVPFLEPVEINGVLYCHYFQNPFSAVNGVISGTIENCMRLMGRSFTMGHQQGLKFCSVSNDRMGLIAGSCYLHDEHYKGPQGNKHWRGVIVKHEVNSGVYDPEFIHIDTIRSRWV